MPIIAATTTKIAMPRPITTNRRPRGVVAVLLSVGGGVRTSAMSETSQGSERRTLTIDETQAGERLDRVLAAAFGDLSRTRLRQLIEQGNVSAGPRVLSDPAHRVKPGTAIALEIPPPESVDVRGQKMDLPIVYE